MHILTDCCLSEQRNVWEHQEQLLSAAMEVIRLVPEKSAGQEKTARAC